MAIVTGVWVGARGSIAGLTFRQLNGVTIVSQRTKPRDTRSRAKMWRRCQWNNVMSMYKLLGLDLIDTLECCRTKRNTCNRYVHLNMERVPIFLTRTQKALGACVVAPHQVSEGSLPEIGHRLSSNNVVVTDIRLSQGIDASTTVASLSGDIVSQNPTLKYGDTLMFCRLQQTEQSVDGITVPRAVKETYLLTLNGMDTRSPLPEGRLQLGCVDGLLALSVPLDNEGACVIHMRQDSSGIRHVSSQQLVCNNELIDRYSGERAFRQSAQSYGGIEQEPFLQPEAEVSYSVDVQVADTTAQADTTVSGSATRQAVATAATTRASHLQVSAVTSRADSRSVATSRAAPLPESAAEA